jgi:hypothetical protein
MLVALNTEAWEFRRSLSPACVYICVRLPEGRPKVGAAPDFILRELLESSSLYVQEGRMLSRNFPSKGK